MMSQGTRTRERKTRLSYPETYTCTTRITKVELGTTNASNYVGYGDRPSITYMLEGSYPYAIDAVPLSYGSSQVTRVTVNFHYVRHTIHYVDNDPALYAPYNPFNDGRTPTSASLTTGP